MIRIALLLTLLVACSGRVETPSVETASPAVQTATTATAPPAQVRTDRSSYVLTHGTHGLEATVVATLRAPAGQALYIVNCNGASSATLQRKVGEAWKWSLVIGMAACLSAPIVVPPGGEHTTRIRVPEYFGGANDPYRDRMIVSGTYRVVWSGVLTSFDTNTRGFGPELLLEQRVSAPFTIEVPPPAQLTAGEAERLVRMLADAINDPARDPAELAPYVLHGPNALRAALVQYRTTLGKGAAVRRVTDFVFELQGAKGTSLVQVHREDRLRIHSALLDYAFRAAVLVTHARSCRTTWNPSSAAGGSKYAVTAWNSASPVHRLSAGRSLLRSCS